MTDFAFPSVADRWPVGTSVGAYTVDAAGRRASSSTASATVQSDGSLTFTGLARGTAYQAFANSTGVFFRTGDGQITAVVALTQAEYDAIDVPDPGTLYVITA